MTKLLERALEAVRRPPPEAQNDIARAMLVLARDEGGPEAVDPAHLPDVLESLAQAKRRQFATDAEVEAAFAASINEAPLHAASSREHRRHCRIYPRIRPGCFAKGARGDLRKSARSESISSCGPPSAAEGVRKFVTRKYSYLVYYTVNEGAEEVIILNIKHPAQRREHEDA
ncbi:MAG TPA: hypothetical protein VGG01_00660 [Xanthobacteraceae bacterium]|jgi:hypothetical protein